MPEKCKCGAKSSARASYSTGSRQGNGFMVVCDNNHHGPWSKTFNGAGYLWNQWQKSPLTLEQVEQSIMFGLKFKQAMERTK